MKYPNQSINCIAAILFTTILGTVLTSTAQPNPDEKPQTSPRRQFNRPDGKGNFAGGAARFTPGFERIFSILTEEQRTSLRDAMQAQRDKVRETEEKLRDARKEIFEAGLKEKFDEDAVRQKAMAAAKLEAEMMVVRAKAFSQIKPPLSAEQIEKLRNLAPPGAEAQSERPRRRPEVQRDENGLPPKDRIPAAPKPN
jgi:Spy/CpxP family protein refolding chaperone